MDAVSAAAPPDDAIAARGLALGFPGSVRPVIAGLDLAVPRHGFVAVVGPSGVGKSTLLRVIAGLLAPSAGDVRLMARPEPGRRPTALVFQDPRLLPWRRVGANVELGLEGLVASRAERRARALAALDLVGLAGEAERWPRQLSGGQRQRVGLARALAVDPDLLLMDEPFSALDAITRQALQDELLAVWQRTRKSVLFVTHDLAEAVYLADRVVLLGGRPARIVRDETIAAARPRRRETAELAYAAERIRTALGEAYAGGEGI